MLGGNLGSFLNGDVSVMVNKKDGADAHTDLHFVFHIGIKQLPL